MKQTNAEKQKAYRQRMIDSGQTQRSYWANNKTSEQIRNTIAQIKATPSNKKEGLQPVVFWATPEEAEIVIPKINNFLTNKREEEQQ